MKAKYLYIISALTLGFMACQQGGYEAEIATNGEMSFNVAAGSTRVLNDTFEVGDKIGVYVTDYINGSPAPLPRRRRSGRRPDKSCAAGRGAR